MTVYNIRPLTVTLGKQAQTAPTKAIRVFSMSASTYLMVGTVSGVRVQWISTGKPDFIGALYNGATPSNIMVAAGPF